VSEIPYVNALGDAFERLAGAAGAPAQRRRRLRARRLRLIVVLVVLVAGGVASASALLGGGSRATELAANGVVCYARGGGVTVQPSHGLSPTALCAGAGGSGLPASRLVACTGGAQTNEPYVMVYPRVHADECARRRLAPLPASYAGAQARVSLLGRALVAVEDSRDCVAFPAFARQAQAILERLGWWGWRVRRGRVLRPGGACAGLSEGSAGKPEIYGSLQVANRTLELFTMPPRSAILGERAVWAELDRVSGGSCLTPAGLEADARSDASAHDLGVAFAITREPRFVGVGDGRQPRYEQGCAVMFGVELVPHASRLDIQILYRSAGSTPAQGSTLPESRYR